MAWVLMIVSCWGSIPAQSWAATTSLLSKQQRQLLLPTTLFRPMLMMGLEVDPREPFHFSFLIHPGDSRLSGPAFKAEALKLIKYFLASLTVPSQDIWVNLSPYESDFTVPDAFGKTVMGRDLLALDYILKKLTASLTHPETESGKKFWSNVYARIYAKFGTTKLPINTFNKVWVIADKADVYIRDQQAFILNSRMKVLMEDDFLAQLNYQKANAVPTGPSESQQALEINRESAQAFKEMLLKEVETEINEGAAFAELRQIYQTLILAYWYKNYLKETIVNQIYSDRYKTSGIHTDDSRDVERIYAQYVDLFKKGVYDLIQSDYDPHSKKEVKRHYFSGGVVFGETLGKVFHEVRHPEGENIDEAYFEGNFRVDTAMLSSASESRAGGAPGDDPKDQGGLTLSRRLDQVISDYILGGSLQIQRDRERRIKSLFMQISDDGAVDGLQILQDKKEALNLLLDATGYYLRASLGPLAPALKPAQRKALEAIQQLSPDQLERVGIILDWILEQQWRTDPKMALLENGVNISFSAGLDNDDPALLARLAEIWQVGFKQMAQFFPPEMLSAFVASPLEVIVLDSGSGRQPDKALVNYDESLRKIVLKKDSDSASLKNLQQDFNEAFRRYSLDQLRRSIRNYFDKQKQESLESALQALRQGPAVNILLLNRFINLASVRDIRAGLPILLKQAETGTISQRDLDKFLNPAAEDAELIVEQGEVVLPEWERSVRAPAFSARMLKFGLLALLALPALAAGATPDEIPTFADAASDVGPDSTSLVTALPESDEPLTATAQQSTSGGGYVKPIEQVLKGMSFDVSLDPQANTAVPKLRKFNFKLIDDFNSFKLANSSSLPERAISSPLMNSPSRIPSVEKVVKPVPDPTLSASAKGLADAQKINDDQLKLQQQESAFIKLNEQALQELRDIPLGKLGDAQFYPVATSGGGSGAGGTPPQFTQVQQISAALTILNNQQDDHQQRLAENEAAQKVIQQQALSSQKVSPSLLREQRYLNHDARALHAGLDEIAVRKQALLKMQSGEKPTAEQKMALHRSLTSRLAADLRVRQDRLVMFSLPEEQTISARYIQQRLDHARDVQLPVLEVDLSQARAKVANSRFNVTVGFYGSYAWNKSRQWRFDPRSGIQVFGIDIPIRPDPAKASRQRAEELERAKAINSATVIKEERILELISLDARLKENRNFQKVMESKLTQGFPDWEAQRWQSELEQEEKEILVRVNQILDLPVDVELVFDLFSQDLNLLWNQIESSVAPDSRVRQGALQLRQRMENSRGLLEQQSSLWAQLVPRYLRYRFRLNPWGPPGIDMGHQVVPTFKLNPKFKGKELAEEITKTKELVKQQRLRTMREVYESLKVFQDRQSVLSSADTGSGGLRELAISRREFLWAQAFLKDRGFSDDELRAVGGAKDDFLKLIAINKIQQQFQIELQFAQQEREEFDRLLAKKDVKSDSKLGKEVNKVSVALGGVKELMKTPSPADLGAQTTASSQRANGVLADKPASLPQRKWTWPSTLEVEQNFGRAQSSNFPSGSQGAVSGPLGEGIAIRWGVINPDNSLEARRLQTQAQRVQQEAQSMLNKIGRNQQLLADVQKNGNAEKIVGQYDPQARLKFWQTNYLLAHYNGTLAKAGFVDRLGFGLIFFSEQPHKEQRVNAMYDYQSRASRAWGWVKNKVFRQPVRGSSSELAVEALITQINYEYAQLQQNLMQAQRRKSMVDQQVDWLVVNFPDAQREIDSYRHSQRVATAEVQVFSSEVAIINSFINDAVQDLGPLKKLQQNLRQFTDRGNQYPKDLNLALLEQRVVQAERALAKASGKKPIAVGSQAGYEFDSDLRRQKAQYSHQVGGTTRLSVQPRNVHSALNQAERQLAAVKLQHSLAVRLRHREELLAAAKIQSAKTLAQSVSELDDSLALLLDNPRLTSSERKQLSQATLMKIHLEMIKYQQDGLLNNDLGARERKRFKVRDPYAAAELIAEANPLLDNFVFLSEAQAWMGLTTTEVNLFWRLLSGNTGLNVWNPHVIYRHGDRAEKQAQEMAKRVQSLNQQKIKEQEIKEIYSLFLILGDLEKRLGILEKQVDLNREAARKIVEDMSGQLNNRLQQSGGELSEVHLTDVIQSISIMEQSLRAYYELESQLNMKEALLAWYIESIGESKRAELGISQESLALRADMGKLAVPVLHNEYQSIVLAKEEIVEKKPEDVLLPVSSSVSESGFVYVRGLGARAEGRKLAASNNEISSNEKDENEGPGAQGEGADISSGDKKDTANDSRRTIQQRQSRLGDDFSMPPMVVNSLIAAAMLGTVVGIAAKRIRPKTGLPFLLAGAGLLFRQEIEETFEQWLNRINQYLQSDEVESGMKNSASLTEMPPTDETMKEQEANDAMMLGQPAGVDQASLNRPPGGMMFDLERDLKLQLRRDLTNGKVLPLLPQQINKIRLEGLVPRIIRVVPAPHVIRDFGIQLNLPFSRNQDPADPRNQDRPALERLGYVGRDQDQTRL